MGLKISTNKKLVGNIQKKINTIIKSAKNNLIKNTIFIVE